MVLGHSHGLGRIGSRGARVANNQGELAAKWLERQPEVGQVVDQRGEVELADRGKGSGRAVRQRWRHDTLPDEVVDESPTVEIGDLAPDRRGRAQWSAGLIAAGADVVDDVLDRALGVDPSSGCLLYTSRCV